MKKYSMQEAFEALEACGVRPGDTMLIHSALYSLGLMQGTTSRTLCETLYTGLRKYLGEKGTLLIPTFFYDYARSGAAYDLRTSPPDKHLGTFVEYAGLRPEMTRSLNPIFNVSGVGPQAAYICTRDTASAFGAGSPWDRMAEADTRIVGFGSPFIDSCTYMMHVEQLAGSPHMYNKVYTAPIYDGGTPVDKLVTAYVRFLDFDIQHDFHRLADRAQRESVVKSAPLGSGKIIGFTCRDIRRLGLQCLKENPYYFLLHPPVFRKGEIPLI